MLVHEVRRRIAGVGIGAAVAAAALALCAPAGAASLYTCLL
jgi:hypothetical protein